MQLLDVDNIAQYVHSIFLDKDELLRDAPPRLLHKARPTL